MVYFTYPETSKVTLEEVSVVFDGKDAVKNDLLDKQVLHEGEEHAQAGEKADTAVEQKELVE